jgi:hypothetical protein
MSTPTPEPVQNPPILPAQPCRMDVSPQNLQKTSRALHAIVPRETYRTAVGGSKRRRTNSSFVGLETPSVSQHLTQFLDARREKQDTLFRGERRPTPPGPTRRDRRPWDFFCVARPRSSIEALKVEVRNE